ncbi:MAG: 1-acyl-sn-glycerol-3-phosphate acyltransferase [Rhodospirillales bacterium]|nr:1-acyl-sn-glycerol-3-phosphate acyltransferase [Rhodospirillales bacterium]
MLFLRSLAFNIAFYTWTTFMVFAFLPALLGPARWVVRGQSLWAGGNLWLMKTLIGIDLEVRGRERIPPGPVIIASKHQSAWDTFVYHKLLDDLAIVLKKELLRIPIYGSYCRKTKMIAVDRKGGSKALRAMLQAGREASAQGRPLLIFPEGTRTAPGTTRPYQPGAAAFYRDLKVPVVPVALNSGLFWPRRRFLRRPGTIVLEFLEPIESGLDRKQFTAELERRIEAGTQALVAEGLPPSSVDSGDI